MKIKQKYRDLVRISLGFLALYLCVLTFYACIYRFGLKNAFYQSNPELDPSFESQISEFLLVICNQYKIGVKSGNHLSCNIDLSNSPIKFVAYNKLISNDLVSRKMGYDKKFTERQINSIRFDFQKIEENFIYLKSYHFNNLAGQAGGGESDGDTIRVDVNSFQYAPHIDLEIIKPSGLNSFFVPADNLNTNNLHQYLTSKSNVFVDAIYYPIKNPIVKLRTDYDFEFFQNLRSLITTKRQIQETSFLKMFYFSGVTIATIGYGDIVPVSWAARLLTISEALIGILILAIMGARLYDLFRFWDNDKKLDEK